MCVLYNSERKKGCCWPLFTHGLGAGVPIVSLTAYLSKDPISVCDKLSRYLKRKQRHFTDTCSQSHGWKERWGFGIIYHLL